MNSPIHKRAGKEFPGRLYVVATPIGNPDDITLRALRVLAEADLIAAEDTRNAGLLLARHDIKTRQISLHEHNEEQRAIELVEGMRQGQTVALIADAGTPSVSDPGYRLVHAAIEAGIPVSPVPGPSALTAALSVSGLATDAFVFVGFPPRKSSGRTDLFRNLADETRTIVMYESPMRIMALLEELEKEWGDRRAVLAREMTKPYEEFLRGPLSAIRLELEKRKAVKGEIVLMIAGKDDGEKVEGETLNAAIMEQLDRSDATPSSIAREIAARFGIPRREVYAEIMKIRRDGDSDET